MLREVCKEIQCLKHVQVFLEVVRIRRVEKNPALGRFVTDFLQRDRRTRDVQREAFLSSRIGYPH